MIEYTLPQLRWRLIDGYPTETQATSDRVAAYPPAEIEIASPTSTGGVVSLRRPDEADAEIVRGLRDQITTQTGLTREDVAEYIGVTRRTLSAWSSGGNHKEENFQRLRVLAKLTTRLEGLGTGTARWIFDPRGPVSLDIKDAVRQGKPETIVQAAMKAIQESATPLPPRLPHVELDAALTDAEFESLAEVVTTPSKPLRSVVDD